MKDICNEQGATNCRADSQLVERLRAAEGPTAQLMANSGRALPKPARPLAGGAIVASEHASETSFDKQRPSRTMALKTLIDL
jgi:hypothetical protein